jgi:hypothetical protein
MVLYSLVVVQVNYFHIFNALIACNYSLAYPHIVPLIKCIQLCGFFTVWRVHPISFDVIALFPRQASSPYQTCMFAKKLEYFSESGQVPKVTRYY